MSVEETKTYVHKCDFCGKKEKTESKLLPQEWIHIQWEGAEKDDCLFCNDSVHLTKKDFCARMGFLLDIASENYSTAECISMREELKRKLLEND